MNKTEIKIFKKKKRKGSSFHIYDLHERKRARGMQRETGERQGQGQAERVGCVYE